MSTQSFRAQPTIVEHLEKGELRQALNLIKAQCLEPEEHLGHLGLVSARLQLMRRNGVEESWRHWFDETLELFIQEALDRRSEYRLAQQAIELFYDPMKQSWYQGIIDEHLAGLQADIRGAEEIVE